jgi:hypothetical protein
MENIEAKMALMEKLYGGEREAAAAIGVSWHAWYLWKRQLRQVSKPIRLLMDFLIEKKALESPKPPANIR